MQWFFKNWKVKRILEKADNPYVLMNQTRSIKSDTLEYLYSNKDITSSIDALTQLNHKLNAMRNKYKSIISFRNEFGHEEELKNPMFSESEIQLFKAQRRKFLFITILFVAAETGLYYLTAQLFVPISNPVLGPIVKLILALFFGVAGMIGLNYTFNKHFTYQFVKNNKDQFSESDLKKHRDSAYMGYFIGAIILLFIIAAGLVRVFYLEGGGDTTGYTVEELKNVHLTATWTAVLTMSITFVLGFLLAMVERDSHENSIKYKVWKDWSYNNKKINGIVSGLKSNYNKVFNIIHTEAERAWQLVIDLKSILKKEYDSEYTGLFEEYQKQRENIREISEDIYNKYEPIQYVQDKIFKYGIINDKRVSDYYTIISKSKENIHSFDGTFWKDENNQK